MRTIAIANTTRKQMPRVPFERIARTVLGPRYRLSLVLCGDARARRLNRTYRKKGYAANVLSFPLEKNEGEVFLNLEAAKREARQYSVSLRGRLVTLFVHACLHLKGRKHGVRMERESARMLKKFL